MLLYVLKLNQNAKMPEAYGKYYAYPVITQTVDIDGLAEHMASHAVWRVRSSMHSAPPSSRILISRLGESINS